MVSTENEPFVLFKIKRTLNMLPQSKKKKYNSVHSKSVIVVLNFKLDPSTYDLTSI